MNHSDDIKRSKNISLLLEIVFDIRKKNFSRKKNCLSYQIVYGKRGKMKKNHIVIYYRQLSSHRISYP